MNKLESVILDQHARVRAAGENPVGALEASQGEILAVANEDLTLNILEDNNRTHPISFIANSRNLAENDMIAPNQGYTGGIIFDQNDAIVYGHSAIYNTIKVEDPIQEAMGKTFYPPMMWVKAIRAEAYKNRPDSARQLSIAEYLAKLGLSLGSMASENGDIAGATGFMPGSRLQGEWGDESVIQHINSEPVEAYRLSGLCDQAVLDPYVVIEKSRFAIRILNATGSLN